MFKMFHLMPVCHKSEFETLRLVPDFEMLLLAYDFEIS